MKVQKQAIQSGDQISLHNVTMDIIRSGGLQPSLHSVAPLPMAPATEHPADPLSPNEGPIPQANTAPKLTLFEKWNQYVEKVIMPGIYKLPEWIEFRWVIGLFVVGFIFMVTVLSSIPMTRILSASVEKESMNHAESIAVALSNENRSALKSDLKTGVNVNYALRRPGVKKAFIINAVDGRIIAPVNRVHEYPNEPFIHQARKTDVQTIEKIDSSTMAAMVPIQLFNPETGTQSVMAYSAVFYDMKSLAINNTQVISLLVQSLFIAVIIGFLLFFFMYRIIAFPIESINEQLSQSLRDASKNISIRYQFPVLESLCSNINSALERLDASHQQMEQQNSPSVDRQHEVSNLVELVGFACLCIQIESNLTIALNNQFEEQTGISGQSLLHQPIDQISDMALQLNLKELVNSVKGNPIQIHEDKLELNSQSFHITAQGIHGQKELEYVLVVFIPEATEDES